MGDRSKEEGKTGTIQRIRDKYPEVDPVEFAEMMTKKIIADLNCDGQPSVIEFCLQMEIEADHNGHLSETYREFTRPKKEEENKQRIKQLQPVIAKKYDDEDVNRPVKAGGLRQLHVVCDNKDRRLSEDEILAEVIRLREEVGADINVKDNSGLKPIDRARIRGYTKVVAYLESELNG